MKKKLILTAAVLTLTLSGGCQKTDNDQTKSSAAETIAEEPAKEEQSEKDSLQTQPTETQSSEATTDKETEAEFSLECLSDRIFNFYSGAGGWSTELIIRSDGTLKGNYHDSDIGDTGDGYPNGTFYYCDFTGRFDNLEKVNEYTYKMKLASLEFGQEPGKEEIIDGTLYICSTAYGLDDGEEFYLYLPGARLADLPEEYLNWVRHSIPEDNDDSTLPFYGLYNVHEENGFSSVEYQAPGLSDKIALEISLAEGRDTELNDQLQKAASQADMNQISADLLQSWDDTLNIVWKLLESELDKAVMEDLRAEEREWISTKEAAAKAASSEYEDGSMQSMEYSLKAAELTKKRVYELAEYADAKTD